MNMTNINVQLLDHSRLPAPARRSTSTRPPCWTPTPAAELDVDTIRKMVDDLIAAHGDYLPSYR